MLARLAVVLFALVLAPAAGAGVLAYPAAQTIPSSGRLPQGGSPALSLNAAIGEREGAWLVATNAHTVSATVDGSALGPLKAQLYFGHFVSFGGRAVPDALLPWNGSARPMEQPNQPLYLQVLVPPDARPGGYSATVTVAADGKPTPIRVSIRVFDVRLPAPSAVQGNLLTAFHVVPQSYVSKVDQLYHLGSNAARSAANAKLFSFLAANRISPAGWGFGEPKSRAGYSASRKWWLDAAGNMVKQSPASFAALRIPISNQRASADNRIAGISPFELDAWCDYLRTVRGFWDAHGWLDGHLSYLYTLDEPGPEGMRLVAQQAATAHRCWPGSNMLVTGNPTAGNRFLWDGKNGDDADIWAVLSRRYYGQYGDRTREAGGDRAGAPGRQDGLVGDLYRRRRQPWLQRRRAPLRPALVPALERARGDPGHALCPGADLVHAGESARRRRRQRRVGARLPGRRRAGGERASGADPRRHRGLGRARRRPPEAGPGRSANDPGERRPVQRHRAAGRARLHGRL